MKNPNVPTTVETVRHPDMQTVTPIPFDTTAPVDFPATEQEAYTGQS